MGNRKRLPRKPTSIDVARAVGVSQSAVSRAFTEGGKVAKKTRERILKVADKIGYVPNIHARSLITRRTGMIALVMGDITNPFYPEVLEILASQDNTQVETESKTQGLSRQTQAPATYALRPCR
jgi:DNA-binding LacI/PurR family transcriptional regulator